MPRQFKVIVFDMDDTLVDTSAQLIPAALGKSIGVMIERGLPCSLEEAMDYSQKFSKSLGHFNLFLSLAKNYVSEAAAQDLAARAYQVFHNPDLPKDFRCFHGVHELLLRLKKNYHLYLVTQGNPESQKRKVKALHLEPYFLGIEYVDVFKKQIKKDAFRKILQQEGIAARQMLSVGNRLSQEIRMAKELGASTCYVRHGEHSSEKPEGTEEVPDFQMSMVTEIEEICRI